mgnify:CR=1 FL=1
MIWVSRLVKADIVDLVVGGDSIEVRQRSCARTRASRVSVAFEILGKKKFRV